METIEEFVYSEEEEEEIFVLLFLETLHQNEFHWNTAWISSVFHSYEAAQFRQTFRMSKHCLASIIQTYFQLASIENSMSHTIEFLMCYYFITRPITYRDLAEKFGVPTTCVFRSCKKHLKQFLDVMIKKFLYLPNHEEMIVLRQKFYDLQPIWGTILAIDGTHLPIEAPVSNSARYINRKGFYSLNFQITVDADFIVRDVFGGFPGCCHDAYLFRNSKLFQWINEEIPHGFFAIADAAYPASSHLLTPYKGTLSQEMEEFNFLHSSQRMRVECTIGRLKGRFKKFAIPGKNGHQKSYMYYFLFACVIHNMIEKFNLDDCTDFYEEFMQSEQ